VMASQTRAVLSLLEVTTHQCGPGLPHPVRIKVTKINIAISLIGDLLKYISTP
jgi:hypothetical protein